MATASAVEIVRREVLIADQHVGVGARPGSPTASDPRRLTHSGGSARRRSGRAC